MSVKLLLPRYIRLFSKCTISVNHRVKQFIEIVSNRYKQMLYKNFLLLHSNLMCYFLNEIHKLITNNFSSIEITWVYFS